MAELTLPYLESLSAGELSALADRNGLDIPPGLERCFIIEELFYLGHDAESAHHDINQFDDRHDGFKEFTALPQQYHLSFIEVLIRDPLWAFAFWEIKAQDRKHYESAAGFDGYCLRITPITLKGDTLKGDAFHADEAASFIVSIDVNDNARYLGFPPDSGRHFKIELCMRSYENYPVLVESRPFTLPRLIGPRPDGFLQSVYGNPLAVLSGVGRFSLVRSEDRPLRSRETTP